jgi:hypothetical protein
MMLKTLLAPFRRFARSEDGTIITETIVIMPILIWAYLAMFVYWDAYRTKNTMIKSSYTVADMISRRLEPVDANYVTGLKTVFDYILNTDEDTGMAVSSVEWIAAQNRYAVQWSSARGEGLEPLTDAMLIDMVDQLPLMSDGDTVIVMQTRVHYVPPFFEPSFWLTVEETNFDNFIVTRPRRTSEIEYVAS